MHNRRRHLRLLAPVVVVGLALAGCSKKDDDGGTIKSLDDLKGKTIGVQADTTGETYANENKPDGAKIKSFSQTDEMFAALQSGQVQALLQDYPINAYRATKTKDFEVVQQYKTDEQYGFVVKKGNSELLAAVNGGLKAAADDGTYDKLFEKYFGAKPETEPTFSGSVPGSAPKTVKSGTLTMCSDTPYAPMEMEGDGPSGYTGFDVELMDSVAKANDLKLAVIDVDFDGILGNLAAGKCDVVGSSVTITDERKKEADFSDPYFDANQSLLVKK